MKISTLRRVFARSKRTKLFIATSKFAVAGHVKRPSNVGAVLSIDVQPYIAYFFSASSLVRGEQPFGPIRLDATTRVTRRLQTHRRHLSERDVPEEYFQESWKL